MNSFIGIFNCCQKVNCIKNKEVDIDSNNPKEEDENENEEDEKSSKKKSNNNKTTTLNNNNGLKKDKNNNNLSLANLLLNQSNQEMYNNFLKNNISLEKQNLSINNLNLDKTQKSISGQEDCNNFSNKVINNNIINNNIIKITNNNNFLNMTQKDFGYISFCAQSNLNKSNISVNKNSKSKNLILSGNLFFGQNVKINQDGIEKSLRNKNEFPIYFGIEPTVDKNGLPYNDYIVNYVPKKKLKKKNSNDEEDKEKKNKEIKENENAKGGRLFQIDKIKNDYILTFIHSSLILYYRINKPIFFDYDKEYYFILGNVFLSVSIKKINEKSNVCVRVETEDQKAEKANFEDEKKIVIGRAENSDVEIDKQCISKCHSVIEYDDNMNQYYYKDNNSTNGSTLLIREDDSIIIKDSMYFKLEDTSFTIKETES